MRLFLPIRPACDRLLTPPHRLSLRCSLFQIYSSPTAVATGTFKPPTPPGKKYAWAPATETIPHGEFAYFPMVSMSAKQI